MSCGRVARLSLYRLLPPVHLVLLLLLHRYKLQGSAAAQRTWQEDSSVFMQPCVGREQVWRTCRYAETYLSYRSDRRHPVQTARSLQQRARVRRKCSRLLRLGSNWASIAATHELVGLMERHCVAAGVCARMKPLAGRDARHVFLGAPGAFEPPAQGRRQLSGWPRR
jgi:hypothetical protein